MAVHIKIFSILLKKNKKLIKKKKLLWNRAAYFDGKCRVIIKIYIKKKIVWDQGSMEPDLVVNVPVNSRGVG